MSDRTFMQKYLKHCQRIVPYVRLYQKQVQYYNQTAYNILQSEINLILPTFNEPNRKKRFLSAVLGIEAEDNFLLESLAACGENNIQKLEMFFTVNLAFLDHLEDLTEVLDTPINRNWTHDKQILPISLESFEINSSLLQAPKTLKD